MTEDGGPRLKWRFAPISPDVKLLQRSPVTNPGGGLLSETLSSLQIDELKSCWSSAFHQFARTPGLSRKLDGCNLIHASDLAEKNLSLFAQSVVGSKAFADFQFADREATCQLKGQSLFNVLRFSPGILRDEFIFLFIVYQIICKVEQLHANQTNHLGLDLTNVYIDGDFHVQLGPPDIEALRAFAVKANILFPQTSTKLSTAPTFSNFSQVSLDWVLNKVSNYDYLMFINRLAGRQAGDPLASAILPWVTDFTVENGGYRDLTKTKFRLKKGESQLDATYRSHSWQHHTPPLYAGEETSSREQTSDVLSTAVWESTASTNETFACLPVAPARRADGLDDAAFLPHHLLDIMPNLAYFTYKARRTPIPVLQKYVRPIYRPEEFPSSMARLYASTPEECIPEFFSDPSVFVSLHTDMPDLGLPEWCTSAEDFLAYHRRILESTQVSKNLHHWIDLTFGYKLLGEAAVEAKNVHLELVGSQRALRSTAGVACLFTVPHPRRLLPSEIWRYFGPDCAANYWKPTPPAPPSTAVAAAAGASQNATEVTGRNHGSASTIQLPPDYNPLELLEHYEELCTFLGMTCGTMPPELNRSVEGPTLEQSAAHSVEDLLRRDVEAVGCLIVELAVHSSLSGYGVDVGIPRRHEERLQRARELYCAHRDLTPGCLRSGIEAILRCGAHGSAPSASEPLHIPSIRDLRTFFFHFPKHIIDFHHLGLGLVIARGDARKPEHLRALISELHLDGIDPPGGLLRAFLPAATVGPFTDEAFAALNSFPTEALPMLFSLLCRAPHSPCIIDSLRSGRLITFVCAIGGKEATERYVLPLMRHIFQPQSLQRLGTAISALYSRHFLRLLLQTTSPRAFLATVLPLLALGLASFSSAEGDAATATPPASEESEVELPPDSSCHMTLAEKETFARWLHVAELSPVVHDFLEAFLPPEGLQKGDGDSEDNGNIAASRSLTIASVPPVAAAQGSLLWLASLLGPVACARRVVTTLLQSLAVCYRGPTQLAPSGGPLRTTLLSPCRPSLKSPLPMPVCMSGRPLVGDRAASASLRCLERVASLYGVRVILDLFLPAVCVAVTRAVNTTSVHAASAQEASQWTVEAEARLISTLVLLHQFVTYLPAKYLMDHLQDPILHQCLMGALTVAGRLDSTFPSGDIGRRALMYKIVDAIYVIGILVGFENTRTEITDAFRFFFSLFDRAALSPGSDTTVPASGATPQDSPRLKRPILFSLDSEQNAGDVPCGVPPTPLDPIPDVQLSPEDTVSSNSSQNPVPPMFVVQLDRHTSALTVSASKCVPAAGARLQMAQASGESILPGSITSETSSVSSFASLCEKTFGPGADDNQKPAPVKSATDASFTVAAYRSPAAFAELRSVFTAELAHMAYIPFCRLAGGDHLDSNLDNIDTVRRLVNEHEAALAAAAASAAAEEQSSTAASSVEVTTRQLQQTSVETAAAAAKSAPAWSSGKSERQTMTINSEYEARLVARPSISKSSATHLQGSWIDYFSNTMTNFPDLPAERLSFQGKRIISFTGHCGAVKCISAFPLENSFLTCGQDRVVQLWSLSLARQLSCRSAPAAPDNPTSSSTIPVDSTSTSRTQCTPRFLFAEHKRPVFAAVYLPFLGLVASNDASLLLWDPVTGKKVTAFYPRTTAQSGGLDEIGLFSTAPSGEAFLPAPLSAMSTSPAFLSSLLCGDETGHLLLVDPRSPPRRAIALRIFALAASSESLLKFTSTGFSSQSLRPEPTSADLPGGSAHHLNEAQTGPPFSGLDSPGPIRSLAAIGDGMTVVCGFDSGLMSAVELRSGQVVALWRAHSDAVSQICTHQSGWFVSSSPDRSVAFWRLHAGRLDCFRSFVHTRAAASGNCSPDVLRNAPHQNTTEPTGQPSPPPASRTMSVSSLVALAPQGSSLVVAGPSAANPQAETFGRVGAGTSSSPVSLLSSSSPSSSNGITSLSALPGSCLGAYRPSRLRELDFHWLGHVGPELLRGQLTALSVLPESQSFLVGSASGALSLLY